MVCASMKLTGYHGKLKVELLCILGVKRNTKYCTLHTILLVVLQNENFFQQKLLTVPFGFSTFGFLIKLLPSFVRYWIGEIKI
jgi:hypothetical protein